MKQDNSACETLKGQLKVVLKVPFETEYPFASSIDRAWKWDIAFLEQKLAVEVDGGIWVKGAHGHPLTILRNMQKRNWGARLGWRILSFSTDEAKKGQALSFIEWVLKGKTDLALGEKYAKQSTQRRRRAPPKKLPGDRPSTSRV